MLTIGIVANEPSGDLLAAGLMQELRTRVPDIRFEGVGGPLMAQQGIENLYPMERLSVMGLVEVVKHLPELLAIRRGLKRHFLSHPPDIFIGIDAPDFNLGLERVLKSAGIPSVHYVSPTVWAWRAGRVNQIRASVDLMLSIFPFEVEFLRRHRVPVSYVGHPLADQIPLESDPSAARQKLGIDQQAKVIALLPGSRVSEIEGLAEPFLQAALRCRQRYPELRIVVPLVSARTRAAFEEIRQARLPELPLTLIDGQGRDVMLASDAVLTASGTATLEALLLQRPMVVAYRVSPLTYWIVKRFNLVKTPFIAMANLLAGEQIAQEFIQDQVTPGALSAALLEILDFPEKVADLQLVCRRVHAELRQNSSGKATDAVLNLLESKR